MRILWRLDITTAMRVKFRGDIYDIKAILPSSDHDYVDLAVVTGVNNG
jgi:SPP1 family predicted phage head-tail adaptor